MTDGHPKFHNQLFLKTERRMRREKDGQIEEKENKEEEGSSGEEVVKMMLGYLYL